MVNKLDYITVLLNEWKTHILCVTEHWLSYDELSEIKIPDFYLADCCCRLHSNQHGGSAIFLRNGIIADKKIDVTNLVKPFVFEPCCVLIQHFNLLCINFYRSSHNCRANYNEFLSYIDEVLHLAIKADKNINSLLF